ncbi:hypothetical protein MUO79_01030 [Candidatus Bathyarchaeota archaeon]|nr:hypothetical protein [Candidatus Bathyarchaeota archaeon]
MAKKKKREQAESVEDTQNAEQQLTAAPELALESKPVPEKNQAKPISEAVKHAKERGYW